MSDGLRNAKALASTLRYSEDTPWNRSVEADSRVEAVREYFSQNALRITHEVTPALHARLSMEATEQATEQAAISPHSPLESGIAGDITASIS